MLELIGGPLDGHRHNWSPPGREVFVNADGSFHKEGRQGATRFLEEGVCHGCGVRFGDGRAGVRRFVLERLASEAPCRLCGTSVV